MIDYKNIMHFGAKKGSERNKEIDARKIRAQLFNKDKNKVKKPRNVKQTICEYLILGTVIWNLIIAPVGNIGRAPLPNEDQVKDNLQTMNIDSTIMTKFDNEQIGRYFVNKTKSRIKVGVSDDFTAEEKKVIKETLDTYNKVFEVINPEYKFEYDKTIGTLEKLDPSYIYIQPIKEELDGSAVAYERSGGMLTMNGLSTVYNSIHMSDNCRTDIGMFRHTLLHEFMHILGVDDAYDKHDFYEQTIMNCTTDYSKTNDIYKYDVALLAALYADLENPEVLKRVQDFVKDYGKNSTYTDTSMYKFKKIRRRKEDEEDEDSMSF